MGCTPQRHHNMPLFVRIDDHERKEGVLYMLFYHSNPPNGHHNVGAPLKPSIIDHTSIIISERAKRASSVPVHVNRDFRYIYICGRTSTSTRMPGKSLLRNGLSN